MIYLASPYTHDSKDVEHERYEAVAKVCAKLARSGDHVYSPIAHWHPIAVEHDMPTDFHWYRAMNESMISRCDSVWVLMLPGWQESKGVKHEIDFANSLGKVVIYLGS